MPALKKDYTGIRIGMLVGIKPTNERNKNDIVWEFLCDCGKTHKCVPKRAQNNCGCNKRFGCEKCTRTKTPRKWEPSISVARYIWQASYSDGGLTFEKFYELSQKNCEYCNRAPSNKYTIKRNRKQSQNQLENGVFVYNGLDRVDSTLSHTLANVVPCCKICNTAKLNMPLSEFLDWIERVYKKQFLTDTRNQTNDYEI